MQKVKPRVALIDFDETLLSIDSLKYILKVEGWHFNFEVLTKGILLAIVLKLKLKFCEIKVRSAFKKKVLELYAKLPLEKKEMYIAYFRSELNHSVIEFIKKQNYDQKIIVSASESGLIQAVLRGVLDWNQVVANHLSNSREPFRTCWGKEKLERIKNAPFFKNSFLELYTDSKDDLPLMQIAHVVYWVNEGKPQRLTQ